MKIAIIGTGNVGGALATRWSLSNHQILLGVKDQNQFKGKHLLTNSQTTLHSIHEAVSMAEVVVLATPAMYAIEVAASLGNTTGKIIIDTMNVVKGRGPQGFTNTADAILANTNSQDIVKCFNTTGFNNMLNPQYGNIAIDMFMAGDSVSGKKLAHKLSLDAGFAECYDIGGNEHFELLEKFAFFWINLAMMRGYSREIAFKLLKR